MSLVSTTLELHDQLRKDGYRGTHKAMRLLKKLRSSLEEVGYTFVSSDEPPVKAVSSKEDETFIEALDQLDCEHRGE